MRLTPYVGILIRILRYPVYRDALDMRIDAGRVAPIRRQARDVCSTPGYIEMYIDAKLRR